jgi:predicted nucleic acid-binding protein
VIYLDTNVMLSLHIDDVNTTSAEEWIRRQTAPLAVSTWSIAEFRGNVGLRVRKKEMPPRQAARIFEDFDTKFMPGMVTLSVNDDAHRRVVAWLQDPACSLQPADALHFSIAIQHDATAIATFDRRFAASAGKLGIRGVKVLELPVVSGGPGKVEQQLANYHVTEKDIAKSVRWARKRKVAEKEKAGRLLVRR